MEDEGSGIGRCIVVLMGGRSGGHNAAVLGAVRIVNLGDSVIQICFRLFIRFILSSRHVGYCIYASNRLPAFVNSSQMDRSVKIWAVRPASPVEIQREDKPLFSSGRIHKARVLSVSWCVAPPLSFFDWNPTSSTESTGLKTTS